MKTKIVFLSFDSVFIWTIIVQNDNKNCHFLSFNSVFIWTIIVQNEKKKLLFYLFNSVFICTIIVQNEKTKIVIFWSNKNTIEWLKNKKFCFHFEQKIVIVLFIQFWKMAYCWHNFMFY